jgi:hypothetical protein
MNNNHIPVTEQDLNSLKSFLPDLVIAGRSKIEQTVRDCALTLDEQKALQIGLNMAVGILGQQVDDKTKAMCLSGLIVAIAESIADSLKPVE